MIDASSMWAIETSTPPVSYRAGKSAMIAFTQQFAIQNAGYGVRANAVLPGRMEAAMAIDTRVRTTGRAREGVVAERNAPVPPRGRGGTGWDVADAALFLASDEADSITGGGPPVGGGAPVEIGW